jgi:membrane protein implicated in regulation of membrane protease activity
MGIVYLAALIVGLGTILLQLVMSSTGGDADAHVGGPDAEADSVDAQADAHSDGGPDSHAGGHTGADIAGFFALFLSLRFWIFACLAFGMTGALATWLHLAGTAVTLVLSLVMGLGSGFLAAWAVRALVQSSVGADASNDDAVGAVGRVLLPFGRGKIGKIRIQLRGQSVDLVARTEEEEQLAVGAAVLVESLQGDQAVVSRAPNELDAPKTLKSSR